MGSTEKMLAEIWLGLARMKAARISLLSVLADQVEAAVAKEMNFTEEKIAALRCAAGFPNPGEGNDDRVPAPVLEAKLLEQLDIALLLRRVVDTPIGERAEAKRELDARASAIEHRVASGECAATVTKH